ncbi:MAG: ATP-binding cassette domain-containing protein, partial [Planctomycetes bacterium]|nr:ATP-binding cassette domain-containing protein [Planctomycetota bacterium]
TTALVGESGCGKTTLGKAIVGLEEINGGTIHYGDLDVSSVKGGKARELRRQIQIVFQDPYSSLNPRMRVQDIVGEGLKIHNLSRNRNQYQERIRELLRMVGLSPGDRLRYPHEFSGGQRQRICIARALSVDPECVVCDEATSALDVSVQAQILNLLTRLQDELGLTYLFITHDLSVVEYFADYIYVMYVGEIVEEGPVEEIFGHPRHPYTRALLSSAPKVDETTGLEKIHLEGPVPSPIDPPAGCRFHPRCPEVREVCRHKTPRVFKSDEGGVCCHMYDEAEAPAWE